MTELAQSRDFFYRAIFSGTVARFFFIARFFLAQLRDFFYRAIF